MRHRTLHLRAVGFAGTAWLVLALGAAPPSLAASEPPRTTMHEIFESLARLLPLVLDEPSFESESGKAEAGALLENLVRTSQVLEAHALRRDGDFRFLARSLAVDFREAQERIQNGQTDQARFFVATAVENCVQCHSRLPKARDYPLAGRLTEHVTLGELPPQERALFLVATRSFSRALQHWEEFFALPQTKPSHLSTQA